VDSATAGASSISRLATDGIREREHGLGLLVDLRKDRPCGVGDRNAAPTTAHREGCESAGVSEGEFRRATEALMGLGGCWGSWMRCYTVVVAEPWPKEQLDLFAAGRGLQTRLHFLVFDN
jgi:hypothetical protein